MLYFNREMQAKLRRSERFKNDLLRLVEEQNAWKREQERVTAEENEKIVEYIKDRDRNIEMQQKAEQERLASILEQQDRMVAALNDIEVINPIDFTQKISWILLMYYCSYVQREKMEHEELLIELKAYELEEKQISLDRKKLEEDIRRRLSAKLGLEEQMHDMELRRTQRAIEEEEFRLEQQRLLAEQDRLALLTREAQRSKKLEHQQQMRVLMEKREASRKAQIAQLIQEHDELMALEKRR